MKRLMASLTSDSTMFTADFLSILQKARKELLKNTASASDTSTSDLVTAVHRMDLHAVVEKIDDVTVKKLEQAQGNLKGLAMVLAKYVELRKKIGKEILDGLLSQDALLEYLKDEDREKYEFYIQLISLWSAGAHINQDIQTGIAQYPDLLMRIAQMLADFDKKD